MIIMEQTQLQKLQSPSPQIAPSADSQLLEIEPITVHVLVNKKKKLICIGKLRLFKRKDRIWIIVNNWNSQEIIQNTRIQRIEYQNNQSYIFENIVAGFISLTVPKDPKIIQQFEEGFKKIGEILGFGEVVGNQKLNRKMEYHCPEIRETPIHSENFFTKFFRLGGKMQSFLGSRTHELHHTNSDHPDLEDRFNHLVRTRLGYLKDTIFGKGRSQFVGDEERAR